MEGPQAPVGDGEFVSLTFRVTALGGRPSGECRSWGGASITGTGVIKETGELTLLHAAPHLRTPRTTLWSRTQGLPRVAPAGPGSSLPVSSPELEKERLVLEPPNLGQFVMAAGSQ